MSFDVVIIGGGPGGYVAAIRAAQLKLKVAVIEDDKLGGICLNWGCIPTKSLLKNAEVLHTIQNAAKFGINIENYSVDWKKVIKRSRDVSGRLNKGIHYLFKKNSIIHFSGRGRLVDKNTIEIKINGKIEKISGKYLIIATGARAKFFPGMEPNGKNIITYKEAMTLPVKPKNLVIIGAGAIGIEFADFFNTFGTQVTLIEGLQQILPGEDLDISVELNKLFSKRGIKIHCNELVLNIQSNGKQVRTNLKSGNSIDADIVLVAVGVQPNIENIGLKKLKIKISKNGISTNQFMQTNIDSIYAIGDVAGPPMLAHKATEEGIIAVEHLAGQEPSPMAYDNIPGCVYCHPEVASIGLTEEQALNQGYKIKIGRFPLKALGKAMATGDTDGFVKVIFDEKYGELLGCHILGNDATNLITEAGIARKLETTWNEILTTIHPHPTLSEAIMEATADALDEAIHI